MKTGPIILKLGGSVITNKRVGKPVVRVRHVKQLAREVSRVCLDGARGSRPPLILLYGGGSFGHPLAHRYQLSGKMLSIDSLNSTIFNGGLFKALRPVGQSQATSTLGAGRVNPFAAF